MSFDTDMINVVYARMREGIDAIREIVGRPLTFLEKISRNHLWDSVAAKAFEKGKEYIGFTPDRIARQDATAQMTFLQFIQTGKGKMDVSTTVL